MGSAFSADSDPNGVRCSLVTSCPNRLKLVYRVSETELATRVVLPFEYAGTEPSPVPSYQKVTSGVSSE
ncbi:MAG: hypothetical protein IPN69_14585 [Acidobacteria bacterium]|nr:hypothetical protein [Acidobacteriota bacterium]